MNELLARPYSTDDVERLRGSVHVEHTLARLGAERLRTLLAEREWVAALGAMTGGQAVQMVRAGLEAIYLSGWQVAADANLAGGHVSRPEPLPGELRAGTRAAHLERTVARRPDLARRGRRRDVLARADRRRRRGGVRRAAQRVRDDEGLHRGRCGSRALRGPASSEKKCGHLGGKVLDPHEPVRADAGRRAARRRCPRRPHPDRRPHRRALRLAADERRGRGRPRAVHGGAHRGGVLPGPGRHRGGDRPGARVRAVRRPRLVRDLDAGHRRGRTVRGRDPRAVPGQAPRLQLLAVVQLARPPVRRRRSPASSATWRAMGYRFQFITLAGFHALNLRCSSSRAATATTR